MPSDNLIYKSYYSWWKNINKTILILIVILFSLGLFFSLVSTSLIASDKLNTNSYYFFIKHLLFIVAGVFLVIFFSSLKHNDLIKLIWTSRRKAFIGLIHPIKYHKLDARLMIQKATKLT